MKNLKKTFQKKIEEIWPGAQKNISKISRDTLKTLKKSEKQLLAIYGQTKKKAEQLILKARREELYYELGKSVAPLLSSDQLKKKNILKISSEIQRLNRQLRSKAH